MGAYLIKWVRFEKDAAGRVTHIYCTADLESRDNPPADGRKVRGTIHWVSAPHAIPARAALYDRLFTLENMGDMPEDRDYDDFRNPDSLKMLEGCRLEPSLAQAKPGDRFQFVRLGYFCRDTKNPEVFNRTVSLKDSYTKTIK